VVSGNGIYSWGTFCAHCEMTTKNFKYYINLVDNVVTELGRIDSNFERSFTVAKMLFNSIACDREEFCERRSSWVP
jgi:hypothetical protein